jgi:hypothetical protein
MERLRANRLLAMVLDPGLAGDARRAMNAETMS